MKMDMAQRLYPRKGSLGLLGLHLIIDGTPELPGKVPPMEKEFCTDFVGTWVRDWLANAPLAAKGAVGDRRACAREAACVSDNQQSTDIHHRYGRSNTMLVWRYASAEVWLLRFLLACDQQARFRDSAF